MKSAINLYGLPIALALTASLMTPSSTIAADRISELRDDASKALTSPDFRIQARAAELIATAEALEPAQDAYFDADYREAAKTLREACVAMDHAACTDLALVYDRGRGTWQDASLARSIYIVSCEAGHLPACERYTQNEGHMIYMYDGPDPTIPHFTRSCAADTAVHCHQLAFKQRDDDARAALLDLACDLGHLDSCSLRKNWDGYIDAARTQCDAGLGAGCAGLALVHRIGEHLEKDPAQEVAYRAQACTLGHAQSCILLGRKYQNGADVPADPAKALDYYERGCKADAKDCWTLAYRYITGDIVEKDAALAIELATRTCAAEDVLPIHPACKHIKGGPLNAPIDLRDHIPDHIRPYAHTAQERCAQDDGKACRLLAWYYGTADVREADKKSRLTELIDRACALGDQKACTIIALRDRSAPDINRLETACNAREGDACLALVRTKSDQSSAARYADLERFCAAGAASVCTLLGETWKTQVGFNYFSAYGLQPRGTNIARARALFQTACDGGDGRGCVNAAIAIDPAMKWKEYADIPKDKDKADALTKRGCILDGAGCDRLAYVYRGLEGDPTDPDKLHALGDLQCRASGRCDLLEQGIILQNRAKLEAELGHLGAALAEDYAAFDVPARAYVRRARRSCRAGRMDGCLRLGGIYGNGDNDFFGLKHQLVQLTWQDALYLHACENGFAQGCAAYARQFEYGYRNDEAKAAKYFRKACQMGYQLVCNN